MYKDLNCFIKNACDLECIVNYDFKNESPYSKIRKQKDSIAKFLVYKEYNKNNGNFDCDNSNGTCPLTDDIYKELWGWSYETRFEIKDILKIKFGEIWSRFSADTMNSYQTTYTRAKKIYGEDKLGKNKLLYEFARYTHTIGNFTLIPFSVDKNTPFNPYRNSEFKDYFDLSLKFIKEKVDAETFKEYIDSFYLNDYVDDNYNILPLISSHKKLLQQEKMRIDDVDMLLPQNEQELNEYLRNVVDKIKSRGKRIAILLTKKYGKNFKIPSLNKEKNVKDIKNSLFAFLKSKFGKILIGFIFTFILSFIGLSILNTVMALKMSGGFSVILDKYGLIASFGAIITDCVLVSISPAFGLTVGVFIAGFIIWFAYLGFANIFLRRCRTCKNLFALKKINSKIIDERVKYFTVENKTRDYDGRFTGETTEQKLPGKVIKRKIHYKCKFCGSDFYKIRTSEERPEVD